ncbi:VWA domain-containing protein [Corallococcus macrosporus]|uniref:VWFA domain-containing protein n=1 Tax=Corallococcus macrosporus DSM 14697 TaxID=1189310 RepID=A0A250JX27_9BACT|nr:VWA domain-containing protein [Corallococcus macrosporus]ATB48273.1 hypothetical protein MYMAC_003899 [Corallococcus macrosporus DSM 14697]
MKRLSLRAVTRVATGLACVVGLWGGVASADEHVLVLLDRTGSMGLQSVPGKTRFQVAKERIVAFLNSAAGEPRRYAFWTFEGTSYTPVYNFNQNATQAQVEAAVNAAVLGGNTPLARSVCAAVDELIGFLPNEFHTKRVYLATDGLENATPSGDQCAGFNSATPYPLLEVNSWQWKVRNKACTGLATAPGACSAGIPPMGLTLIVDIDHLFDYVPLRAGSLLEPDDAGRDFASLTPERDAAFFTGLADETQGAYKAITPSTPQSEATPLAGDANLDGCVDVSDRSVVLSLYGQGVPSGSPADFNRDRVVNVYDYNTVLQNYGSGCP